MRKWTKVALVAVGLVLSGSAGACGAGKAEGRDGAGKEVVLRVGAEVFMDGVRRGDMKGKRLGIVANQTSVVRRSHLVDTLIAEGCKIGKIFCPEHGFRGNEEAGVHVGNSVDSALGLQIVSLYGKNKKPTREQMEGIDCMVYDLQDVGCRFYTYLSTLHYVMEACAERDVELYVLDRPNPNGHYVDGPVLDTSTQRSFVGMHPVPVVYGMTIGEYARMINGEGWIKGHCRLTVVPMEGYWRDSVGYVLPVAPSPNLRNAHAIGLYPSLCFFEGTVCGVGRGTDAPFERVSMGKDTIDLREERVENKISLKYVQEMYRKAGKNSFFLKSNFFDKLAGTAELRQQIMAGMSEEEIRETWKEDIQWFMQIREKYLIY